MVIIETFAAQAACRATDRPSGNSRSGSTHHDADRHHLARQLGMMVQEWLARPGCRIKLHFIPSYCKRSSHPTFKAVS
jgi:hypothetical protein